MFWLKKYETSENFVTDYQNRSVYAWSLIQKDRSNNVINTLNRPGAYKYNGEIYYDVIQYNKSLSGGGTIHPRASILLLGLLFTFPSAYQYTKQGFYDAFDSILNDGSISLITYDINAILENQRNNYVPTASLFFNSFRIASFYGFNGDSNKCYSVIPTLDGMINNSAFEGSDISFDEQTSITRMGYLKDWLIDTFVS